MWWDDYKKYFYERKPSAKNVDPGDLTAQKAIREKLQCKSFDWFMKEIAYDLPKFFPLVEPTNGAKGSLNFFNPRAVGMAVARPQGFEIDSRGHFTANKIQNVTNLKFRSLALTFNSKFDHKLLSSSKIT